MIDRRSFLKGLAIFAAAPVIVRASSLMVVKPMDWAIDADAIMGFHSEDEWRQYQLESMVIRAMNRTRDGIARSLWGT